MGKLLFVVALLALAWWVLRPARRTPRRTVSHPAPARKVAPRAGDPKGDAVPMVRVYDAASRDVVWVSASELAPGMIEARVEGVEGLVWVEPELRAEPQARSKAP